MWEEKQGKPFGSLTFKQLAHDVVFGVGSGGTKSNQIIANTEIKASRLTNCCNANQTHNFTQDEIAVISNAIGDFRMVEDLCRKCGGTFHKLGEYGGAVSPNSSESNSNSAILGLISHIGELAEQYKKARDDNKISPNECVDLDRILWIIRDKVIELSGLINGMVIK